MQSIETTATTATAESTVGSAQQATLPVGFVVGQRVKVTSDLDKLGMLATKHAGRFGTITKRLDGGRHWDVTFKGRNGGVVTMADDQLEAQPL